MEGEEWQDYAAYLSSLWPSTEQEGEHSMLALSERDLLDYSDIVSAPTDETEPEPASPVSSSSSSEVSEIETGGPPALRAPEWVNTHDITEKSSGISFISIIFSSN